MSDASVNDAPISPEADKAPRRLRQVLLPSAGGLFLILMLALFMFERPLQLLGDGGTGRHIATGLYVLQHGHPQRTNDITWLFANNPWHTNTVWADTIFGIAYRTASLNGVVLISALSIGLALMLCYQIARARGMSSFVGMLLTTLVMLVTSLHWTARPHILTYPIFLAYFYLVFVWRGKNSYKLVLITLLQIAWLNLHGTYYLGLGMLICKLIDSLFTKEDRKWSFMILVAGLSTCALNMNGNSDSNIANIFTYMTRVTGTIKNDEWRNIDFSPGVRIWLFLALALGQFTIWTYATKRVRIGEFLYGCGLFVFGLYAMRLIPYAALFMPLAVAPFINQVLTPFMPKKIAASDERISKSEPWAWQATALWCSLTVLLCGVWLATPAFKIATFDPMLLPVECTRKLAHTAQPNSHVFTKDNWASWVNFQTKLPIFIDDFHNDYPISTIDDYRRMLYAEQNWADTFAKYKFDWVLVPSDMPINLLLRKDPHWKLVCSDGTASLFSADRSAE